jgi:hypothetical protein
MPPVIAFTCGYPGSDAGNGSDIAVRVGIGSVHAREAEAYDGPGRHETT